MRKFDIRSHHEPINLRDFMSDLDKDMLCKEDLDKFWADLQNNILTDFEGINAKIVHLNPNLQHTFSLREFVSFKTPNKIVQLSKIGEVD